jgi:hypothetical protein
MPNDSGISKAVRVWLSVGTSVFIGAAGAGCTDPGDEAARDSAGAGDVAAQAAGASDSATLPGPAAGGEGEGEGASTTDPVSDDIEYLHQLGQVRGHLAAFTALHRLGAHDMAMTHAKHPESELYTGLVPAFAAHGKAGFADELDALTEAVGKGANIDAAYADVMNAISENEPDADFATRLMAIATLARTAGNEFAIGVADDGTVVNAHEYQDAYGFLTAAREMLANKEAADAQEAQALALGDQQLQIALAEFDTLTATRVNGDASVIHGAAARIEIEANML